MAQNQQGTNQQQTAKAKAAAAQSTASKNPAAQQKAAVQTQALSKRNAATAGLNAGLPSHDRHAMIEEAAFFRAEKRGFSAGGELDDWLTSEHYIDQMLNF